jgi:hypothetical protein
MCLKHGAFRTAALRSRTARRSAGLPRHVWTGRRGAAFEIGLFAMVRPLGAHSRAKEKETVMSQSITMLKLEDACFEAEAAASGGSRGWLRSSVARLLGAALSAIAVGCGATVENEPPGGELGTSAQALRCVGDPSNPNCPWKGEWSQLLPENDTDITHTWGPALCSSTPGWMAVSVDNQNRFRVLQWSPLNRGPDWGFYGSSRTWRSKPTCAMREDYATGRPGFVIAGKLRSNDGNNNKIMASAGAMAPSAQFPDNPTPEPGAAGAFAPVSNTTYSSGGLPALGSMLDDFGGGAVVVAFMGDDARTIYAHNRNLPYHEHGWSTRITGPVLPGSWRVVYAPTVARHPQTFQIVIHARNQTTGADALFQTHFYTNGDNVAHFSNEIGSPVVAWTQLASVGTIDDDPWITNSSAHGVTAYFKRGTQIMETSLPSYAGSVLAVKPINGVQFGSSPAATANTPFDMGTHVVIARTTSNQLFYVDSNQDVNLEP